MTVAVVAGGHVGWPASSLPPPLPAGVAVDALLTELLDSLGPGAVG